MLCYGNLHMSKNYFLFTQSVCRQIFIVHCAIYFSSNFFSHANSFTCSMLQYVLFRTSPVSKTLSLCVACSNRTGYNQGAQQGGIYPVKEKYFPCNPAPQDEFNSHNCSYGSFMTHPYFLKRESRKKYTYRINILSGVKCRLRKS
jgi:hypothetical protein